MIIRAKEEYETLEQTSEEKNYNAQITLPTTQIVVWIEDVNRFWGMIIKAETIMKECVEKWKINLERMKIINIIQQL